MYDFLFELTEYSENEGAQILCEAASDAEQDYFDDNYREMEDDEVLWDGQ